MAFPIKSHLPLITTHIEFQFNVLPPPPLVTTRQDLGARIRRQVRHKSTPYSRPRHICKETRVRSRSVTFDHESESVLSEISDSDEDSEGSVNLNKIPKPNGEAGRANSGGYNLEKALGWEEKRFNAFTKFINEGVTKKLDIKLCYSKQKPAKIEECIQLVAQRFNIINVYLNDWPIRDALKLRLKYTSDFERKKIQRKTEANLKQILKQSKKDVESDNDD